MKQWSVSGAPLTEPSITLFSMALLRWLFILLGRVASILSFFRRQKLKSIIEISIAKETSYQP